MHNDLTWMRFQSCEGCTHNVKLATASWSFSADYQDFMLLKKVSGYSSVIVLITPSPSILARNRTNHLIVIRDSNSITLAVNGTNSGIWYDCDITGLSLAGIVSSPFNGAPTSDARFDYFSVTALPASVTATDALTCTLPPNHPSGWQSEGPPINRYREDGRTCPDGIRCCFLPGIHISGRFSKPVSFLATFPGDTNWS
jgi:hypothetical protein